METALGFIIRIIGALPNSYSKMMISDRPVGQMSCHLGKPWETSGDAVGCAESLRIVAKAQQIQAKDPSGDRDSTQPWASDDHF